MNTVEEIYQDAEDYRDHLATVDQRGKRIWVFPKKPKGRFYNARTWASFVLLAVLIGQPFIRINGEPCLLFNVLEGKFVLFGIVFTPQDFHLFALAMVTLMVFVVLFTVVFGRLFCGWVCPQTIFMEMVFRKIEYWIEGDASEQRRLAKAPWTTDKVLKKGSKHAIFFAIAVFIANIFLCYIIGSDAVIKIITEPVSQHFGGFVAVLVFSSLFYGVFAFLREQVCTTVCPYGRLQSVLLVPESIVVHYDFVRGEPRGKVKKSPLAVGNLPLAFPLPTANSQLPIAPLGDCIDCKACVHVCPTGIDIRNGTQLECVNCTACMDACDDIMDKVGRPRGLIRYDSFTGIKSGKRKIFTGRVWAYSAVLVALVVLQGFLLATRSDLETVLLRTPGQLFQKVDETHLSNLYNWEVINKTGHDISNVEFKLKSPPGGNIRLVASQGSIVAPKQGLVKGVLFIDLPKDQLQGRKTKLLVEVWAEGKLVDEAKTNFLGPIK